MQKRTEMFKCTVKAELGTKRQNINYLFPPIPIKSDGYIKTHRPGCMGDYFLVVNCIAF